MLLNLRMAMFNVEAFLREVSGVQRHVLCKTVDQGILNVR